MLVQGQRGQNYDQFEQLKQQIQTKVIYDTSQNVYKNNPRSLHKVEKQKLGLIINNNFDDKQNIFVNFNNKKYQEGIKGNIFKVGNSIFKSNFQNGSLGGVQMIGNNVFRISLQKQTNSNRGNTWFYFSVQGLKGQAHFIITGYRKKSSLYNQGMKICYRNIKQMKWKRGGSQISYARDNDDDQNLSYNVRFTFYFKSDDNSPTQFAYCIPYGLIQLKTLIDNLKGKAHIQTLANSFEGRNFMALNIGNMQSKQMIVLSARVHPGQTVSSFIMQGFIKQLVSESKHSKFLKQKFLFKIVPMINVDGVHHGNFRLSASGVDLNRRWKEPSQDRHPEIYYFKQMILKESKTKQIKMFIDMHGHSRKKNVFFYGCCHQNMQKQESVKAKFFPYLMSNLHSTFSYKNCSFKIQAQKQGTARVSLWKQLKINQIYTLEASFCGNEKQSNYLQADLYKIGKKLCQGLTIYFYESSSGTTQQMNESIVWRQRIKTQFTNSPQLMQMGDKDSNGSDSEPEVGQKQQMKHFDKIIFSNQKLKRKYFKDTNKPLSKKIIDYSELQIPKWLQRNDTIEDNSVLTYEQKPNLNVQQGDKLATLSTRNVMMSNRRQRTNSAMVRDTCRKNNSLNNYRENESNLLGKLKQRQRQTTSFENAQYLRIKSYLKKNNFKSTPKIVPNILGSSKNQITNDPKDWGFRSLQKVIVPRFYTNKKCKHLDKKLNGSLSRSIKIEAQLTSRVICKGTKIGM